ncbi:hypothetical protein [Alcanivorax jadensis]|uniref:hypothetical protein n=1 Tax=Alcanivorax jadensis TaxID=64988 RepID=UPI0023569F2E|nr:hypothetical protein [Alcanivorax jadensis]|tara:strand:+ start:1085 stop:2602 length:1518 start_codon:yes stop_codon:yes gene_type:complete
MRRQGEIEALELRNQLSQWELDNLRDPENGALYTQGKNAFGVGERALSSYDEYISELEQNGANKRILGELSARQRQQMASRLSQHEGQARNQYAKETTAATIKQTETNIAAYWNDDAKVDEEIRWGEAAILRQSREAGAPAEATENALAEYRSKAQTNRILIAMDENPVMAKEMLDDISGDLLPMDREDLERRLDEPLKREEGDGIGRSIFRDYGQDPDRQAAAMDRLNAIDDPDQRRYAKAMYRELAAAEKQRQTESYNADLESAWNVVLDGGNWRSIPSSQWGRLDAGDRKSIMSWKAGGSTDWASYTYLSELYAREPRTFAEMDLSPYLGNLGDSERKQVLGWRREALSDDATDVNKRAWIDTKNNIIKSALGSLKIETGQKASPDEIQKSNAFRGAVQRRYETWMGDNPDAKEMPEGEFRKMVNQMATEVSLPGTGFFVDDTAVAYELPEGAEVAVDVDDVPRDQRVMIEDALNRRGLPVTDDLIVRYYLRGSGLRVQTDD